MRLLILSLLLFSGSWSVSAQAPDSLDLTRELLQQGKFRKAYRLIRTYSSDHPDDFNSIWLFAHTSYFARHFEQSDRLYQKAAALQPGNYYLKLDYARMLVNTGKYLKATPLLMEWQSYDSLNGLALLTRARMDYDLSNYSSALRSLNKITSGSDAFSEASQLKQEVELAKAPWVSFKANYSDDDQPMRAIFPELAAGWFLTAKSALSIRLMVPVFMINGHSTTGVMAEVGNKSYFARPRMGFDLQAGIWKYPANEGVTWTGRVTVDKTFLRCLNVSLGAERNPYYSTVLAVDTGIMENLLTGSLGWTDPNGWNARFTADIRNYPYDRNKVFAYNGWIFAPPVKFSVLDIRFGVGYSYSTSQKSEFVAEKTLSAILADYDSTEKIKGIYNPYFTPRNQHVVTAFASVAIYPARKIDIRLKANAGVYATADIPYLYLDKDPSNNIILSRGFSRERFFPVQLSASCGFQVAPGVRIGLNYQYLSTYYFNRHVVGLDLKIHPVHASRRGK